MKVSLDSVKKLNPCHKRIYHGKARLRGSFLSRSLAFVLSCSLRKREPFSAGDMDFGFKIRCSLYVLIKQ